MEIYIRCFELDQIRVSITLQIENMDDDRSEYNLSSRELGPLAALGSIGLVDWPLELPLLHMMEVFETPVNLVTRASRHYILALLQATYRLILSLDNLGNLSQMFSAVHGGYSTLRDGALKGNVLSGSILGLGGVTIGVGQWALGQATGVTEFVSSATAKFTFDGHFKYHRAHAQQQRPKNLLAGMQIGFEVLEEAVKSGLTGITVQPLRESASTSGYVLGVSRGAVGFVAKVASGSAFFVSKSCEGLAASLHRTPFNRSKPMLLLRVRQPRRFADGVLLPYPPRVRLKDHDDDEHDSHHRHGMDGLGLSTIARRTFSKGIRKSHRSVRATRSTSSAYVPSRSRAARDADAAAEASKDRSRASKLFHAFARRVGWSRTLLPGRASQPGGGVSRGRSARGTYASARDSLHDHGQHEYGRADDDGAGVGPRERISRGAALVSRRASSSRAAPRITKLISIEEMADSIEEMADQLSERDASQDPEVGQTTGKDRPSTRNKRGATTVRFSGM